MVSSEILEKLNTRFLRRGLDEGLAEAISSLLWVAPRLQADVPELKLIADQLMLKYGKPYTQVSYSTIQGNKYTLRGVIV